MSLFGSLSAVRLVSSSHDSRCDDENPHNFSGDSSRIIRTGGVRGGVRSLESRSDRAGVAVC